MRRFRIALLALALAVGVCAAPASAQAALPPVGHVFVIVLENESGATTFGPGSPAPYLSQTLRGQGAYLPNYYATGHQSNDNYISMVSGQAPNTENQADCQNYDDLEPGTITSYGQAAGEGCIYPAAVQNIGDQLLSTGRTWRDYNEDMGATPSREASVCGHPGVNMVDNTQKATASDEYATRHDPFVYFHSIIDDTTLCDTHVVNLDLLPKDLSSAADTPNYVFITPDLCNDGHDSPCANGQPGGLAQADQFLRQWVPQITNSPAFKQQNGLLIITFDESDVTDSSSCCGEIPGPGSPGPGAPGPGGGQIGAVLLSPCIAPGTVSQQPYNHYTMLRSVEDLFGLPHLGYAQLPGETSFGSDVFTRACGASAPGRASQGAGDRLERGDAPENSRELERQPDRGAVQRAGAEDERAAGDRVAHAAGVDDASVTDVRRRARQDLPVPGAGGGAVRRRRSVVHRNDRCPHLRAPAAAGSSGAAGD